MTAAIYQLEPLGLPLYDSMQELVVVLAESLKETDDLEEIVAIIKTDNVLSDEELRQAMERSKGLKVTG